MVHTTACTLKLHSNSFIPSATWLWNHLSTVTVFILILSKITILPWKSNFLSQEEPQAVVSKSCNICLLFAFCAVLAVLDAFLEFIPFTDSSLCWLLVYISLADSSNYSKCVYVSTFVVSCGQTLFRTEGKGLGHGHRATCRPGI